MQVGDSNLGKEIEKTKPKFHIFGHIHEGYGSSFDGDTLFVNASTCTIRYRPTNPPIVLDIDVGPP